MSIQSRLAFNNICETLAQISKYFLLLYVIIGYLFLNVAK